jgi:hypothetical protein
MASSAMRHPSDASGAPGRAATVLGDAALARFAARFELSDDGRFCAAAAVLFFERTAAAAARSRHALRVAATEHSASEEVVLARLLAGGAGEW